MKVRKKDAGPEPAEDRQIQSCLRHLWRGTKDRKVGSDRGVIEWFRGEAQWISGRCHGHSAQIIDFVVVFKAAQLLSCQIPFLIPPKPSQNGLTNLFSFGAG